MGEAFAFLCGHTPRIIPQRSGHNPSTSLVPTNAPSGRPARLAGRDRLGRPDVAAGEAVALLTTDYPPGFLRWMTFRDHVWAATLHGILAGSMALMVPGIPQRDRRVLLTRATNPGRAIMPVPAATWRPSSSSFPYLLLEVQRHADIVVHVTKTDPHPWPSVLSCPVELPFGNMSGDPPGTRGCPCFLALRGI
jgi:hypothetical protein